MGVQLLSCFCKMKQKEISLFDLFIYCKLKLPMQLPLLVLGEEIWKIS